MAGGALVALLIPAAITVLGWFIVAKQAEKREYRKEIRERIAELREVGRETHTAAVEYWLNSTAKTAPAAAVSLKADINRLARQTTILASAGLKLDEASLVQRVRQAATSGEFEKAGRRHKSADTEIVTETAAAIEELIMAAETAFYERFKPVTGNNLPLIVLTIVVLALVFSFADKTFISPAPPTVPQSKSRLPSVGTDQGTPASSLQPARPQKTPQGKSPAAAGPSKS